MMRKDRRIIYTSDLALRDKHKPGLHRSCFFGEIETADVILTDMPAVRDSYTAAGVKVEWIGRKARKKKAVKSDGVRDSSGI